MSEEEKQQQTQDEETQVEEVEETQEKAPESDEQTEAAEEQETAAPESDGNGQTTDFGILDLDDIQTIPKDELVEKREETDEEEEQLRSLLSDTLKDIGENQITEGRVLSINEREVVVDIGFKAEGLIPIEEFEGDDLPEPGEEVDVYIDFLEDEDGQLILSKRKADFMKQWEKVANAEANDEEVEGTIVRRVKGGMMVDVSGVNCFLPGSQIDVRPIQDFDAYVGQTFNFKIVKINEMRKNVVLSRKVILEENLKERRKELLKDIEVGQVLQGRVKNITDFGVFVDLGGIDGLIHITDLSWGRVNHPSEVANLEEVIDVMVIDYDEEKQRVSLGLKQLQPHPWDSVEEKYPVGSVVTGKVVSITNYGAFVELEKGIEGLVHISEISWVKHIKHPSEVFSLGEEIDVKVLDIQPEEQKISLGVKQLEPDPWEEIEKKFEPGSIVTGIVRNLTQFGAFVELEEGIDGLIHVSDMSWTRKIRHPKEILSKSDEVQVKVLDVSKDERKISLGLKQVEEDPWPKIKEKFKIGTTTQGKVERILNKGIIVNLELDVEGIVPLSHIPKKDRKQMTQNIQVGDEMELKVIDINEDDKKIVLSRDEFIQDKDQHEVDMFMKTQGGQAAEKIEIPEEVRKTIEEGESQAEEEPESTEAEEEVTEKATANEVDEGTDEEEDAAQPESAEDDEEAVKAEEAEEADEEEATEAKSEADEANDKSEEKEEDDVEEEPEDDGDAEDDVDEDEDEDEDEESEK
ncbi:MAG: 30S ribosomal protein S1 [Candidatus Marinimicrobia bacterium]|nr:30S ribosomal protein S1 [Candidatus Neomarinimicrobiota bacterium]MCF7828570.1 30S ribosomal protein S1 [Candidatus Neomarinimicrobiota bacterium]MCF7880311.1 30S ribosomal protein S1 [Candidatus Neomarinimicrobiota bacterium]